MSEKGNNTEDNTNIEDFCDTTFNCDFFKNIYNVTTQIQLNNLIKEFNIISPTLRVLMYNFLIYQNKDNKDFIIIKDSIISQAIIDYIIFLFKKDVEKRIINNYYEIFKKENKIIDYYDELMKTKKETPYYEDYQKMIKNENTIKKIIAEINKNRNLLENVIKKFYKEMKNKDKFTEKIEN